MFNIEDCANLTKEQIIELLKKENSSAADAGIIRTRKGALMVRVSNERWPIAMYRRDWEILLSKVPQIKTALETLDIPDVNPQPATTAHTERVTVQPAPQVVRRVA